MAVLVQNVAVTIAALGAATYFVRRMLGRPHQTPATAGPPCLSGAGCQMHTPARKSRAGSAEKPAPVR